MKAYQWQNSAVARFVRMVFFTLAVDCGCGKTFAGIMIALAKRLPTVIIAPGHQLCSQWKRDLEAHAGPDASVWVYDRNEERKQGDCYKEEFERWLKT
jgi:superfamily II DNA or RNA helicase